MRRFLNARLSGRLRRSHGTAWRRIVVGALLVVGASNARAAQPFESMDALSREAYAAMAVEMCDHIMPGSQARLTVARRIAAETGASLDSVLTEFHNLRMVALMDISQEGCDSPNVSAMRAHYGHGAGAGTEDGS